MREGGLQRLLFSIAVPDALGQARLRPGLGCALFGLLLLCLSDRVRAGRRVVDASEEDEEGDGVHDGGVGTRDQCRCKTPSVPIPATPLGGAWLLAGLRLGLFSLLQFLRLRRRWCAVGSGVHTDQEGDEGDGVHGGFVLVVVVRRTKSGAVPKPPPYHADGRWPVSMRDKGLRPVLVERSDAHVEQACQGASPCPIKRTRGSSATPGPRTPRSSASAGTGSHRGCSPCR